MDVKIKILLGFVVLVLVPVVFIINDDNLNNYYTCNRLGNFKKEDYNGVVVKKFINEANHSMRTVKLTNNLDIVLNEDTSSFYQFIEKNDSIVKVKGSDELKVFRSGQMFKFKIYFPCIVK
ncbi:hypothetical protein [Pedobacter gandavensis]|uniref:hypothetical protein n=1 Tax=Pedobacter gandavensis TaxID=2679963 RepID=UPI002930A9D3|nr:hypothetical protein [Pedobacter gandavensis]